jgi:hypothetical protein
VVKGTTLTFKPIPNPSAATWPTGKPVWGGTAGASGPSDPDYTKKVTFNTLSSNSTDYKTVTAECGNTVTLNVVVAEVLLDNVSNADSIGDLNGRAVYATAKAAGANVTITLKTNPAGVALPDGTVTWTGGNPSASQMSRTVSKVALIEGGMDVTAVAGSSQVKVKVYVFEGPPTAAATTVNITRTRDDTIVQANEFGACLSAPASLAATKTYKIYYSNKKWKFVFEKVEYEVKWGVHSLGRTDVPDGSANPFPLGMGMDEESAEAEKRAQAILDLTPNENGGILLSKYWSEALTISHETYHMDDWEGNYFRPMIPDVEDSIELTEVAVTLYNLDPTAVLNDKKNTFNSFYAGADVKAWNDPDPDGYYQGAEERAYADVKDDFQALADSIEL